MDEEEMTPLMRYRTAAAELLGKSGAELGMGDACGMQGPAGYPAVDMDRLSV